MNFIFNLYKVSFLKIMRFPSSHNSQNISWCFPTPHFYGNYSKEISSFSIFVVVCCWGVSVIYQILWKQCACQCIFIYSSISITGPIICLQSGSLQTNYPCENTRLHFFEIESFGLNQLFGRYSFACTHHHRICMYSDSLITVTMGSQNILR